MFCIIYFPVGDVLMQKMTNIYKIKSFIFFSIIFMMFAIPAVTATNDVYDMGIKSNTSMDFSTSTPQYIKVISSIEENGDKILNDVSKKLYVIKTANITKTESRAFQNKNEFVNVEVKTSPRASGGITIELFCKDNIGHYMPIWGGSITKETSEYTFTKQDIHRQNIDGCYFAVVDSTAEMEAMS